MNRILASTFILAALVLQATPAHATILLDNTSAAGVGGIWAKTSNPIGFVFTPQANYTLTNLRASIYADNVGGSSATETFSFSLWNVNGSQLPVGSALATASEVATFSTLSGSATDTTFDLTSNATGSWDVTSGTTYAVTFSAPNGNVLRTDPTVDPTTPNAVYAGRLFGSGTPTNWAFLTDFTPLLELTATPTAVPEPSTWALALAGVTCSAWGIARRRRRAAGSAREV